VSDTQAGHPSRPGGHPQTTHGGLPERSDHLRMLRHALRTPVNHIIGYSELLLEEAEDHDLHDISPDLQKIHTAAEHLLTLINDICDPAKDGVDPIDPVQMQHEVRTPLNQVIGYSELLQEEARDQGLEGFIPDLQRINAAAKHLLTLVVDHLEEDREHQRGSLAQPAGLSVPAGVRSSLVIVSAPSDRKAGTAQIERGSLLVVDDNDMNRDMLSRRLRREGHGVTLAENGRQALDALRAKPFDLVLLDIMMPEMDGFQVLERLKADNTLRHIPVIMLSALDDVESVVRCIEMGAEDYLHKPFDPVLLRARIGASLEKKRLRDQEQAYLSVIKREQERSEHLLLNILPAEIAERLKRDEGIIADSFAEVTVLFADIVGFSELAACIAPTSLVASLNEIFSTFDRMAERHGLEKIKMIGDAYMAVAGLPTPRADHAEAVAEMALDMQREISQFSAEGGRTFSMRIGIDCGPVVAGVIGIKKFSYDLWGDTVNTASRMESHAPVGCIQVTAATYERLRDKYLFEAREPIRVKGKGEMRTYILTGRKVV
jgi:adenylate cyclase